MDICIPFILQHIDVVDILNYMNSVRTKNLKYQRFTSTGCKDTRNKTFELWQKLNYFQTKWTSEIKGFAGYLGKKRDVELEVSKLESSQRDLNFVKT